MPIFTIGQFIAKYRVVRKLGEGGMGAVYEVEDPAIGQRGALKVITLDVGAHPELFQRFVREARAANQIRHPGVVKVFDFGHSDGAPWLVMEYLEGESLAGRMTTMLRFPERCMGVAGLWVGSELASVLLAAHRAGITHRDLKPANVMLVPDPLSDTGERVKLLDFGIAKLHGDSLTQSGTMLGTPVYMAPEQFKNAAAVDGQADTYSLGTILYQILCGRLPYQVEGGGDNTYALMAAKCFTEPAPLSAYAPALPRELHALVMGMLAREPSQRPTIAAVEIELRRLLGLPPPRASGFQHQVVGPAPEKTAAQAAAVDPELLVPTVDGPASESEQPGAARRAAEAVKAETPSGAAGEISPVGMPVPPSISNQPSLLATPAGPALRAAPAERTTPGAPALRLATALASPSSPTSAAPARRRWRPIVAGALALAATIATTATLWTMRPPVQPARHLADPPSTSSGANHENPSGRAHPTTPDLAAASVAPADLLPAAPTLLPGAQFVREAATPSSPVPAQGGVSLRHPKPTCVAPTSACVTGAMTSEQRHAVLQALDEADMKLCPGESLTITGRPALAVRGQGIRREALDQFLFALRGWLAKGKLPAPARGDIRCKAK